VTARYLRYCGVAAATIATACAWSAAAADEPVDVKIDGEASAVAALDDDGSPAGDIDARVREIGRAHV